jgi:hypothetical protein
MKTYQTKASIEVLPNGKTEVLYEVSDGYYAELDTFLKEKEERGKEAVKAVKTIGKKEKVKAFLKKAIGERMAKKAKAVEAKKASKPKESKKTGFPDVEEWLHGLVKIHMVEEDMATDDNVEEKYQELQDSGEYGEVEEEAIMAYGGHDAIVEMMVKNFKKKGYTVAQIKKGMRNVDEGYTMFDDYLGKK